MARKLRPRKGTTAQNNAYTGAAAEITIDTTKKTLVVHDGATAGGNPLPTLADVTATISSLIGVPSGVASLDAGGKVPSAQLPSYVDDVLEYADYAALPATGETGKIYITQDTGASYRWTGTVYIKLSDDDDVLEFANLAAFPVSGAGAALYIAADAGLLYRWNGAAYVSMGLSAIPTMTMLGNNTGGSAVPTALTKADVQTLLDIGWVLQTRTTAAPNATVPAHAHTATGTETDIDYVIRPKGTGAILAQIPDSTSTGGDKRGSRAVDLQSSRTAATQVASGASSVIVGGSNNLANSSSAVVVGGTTNTASNTYAAVVCGTLNSATAYGTAVVGGESNTASGTTAFIGGGYANTAAGARAVVGGGDTCSASGDYSAVMGGRNNTASGAYSAVLGGYYGASGSRSGVTVYASGRFAVAGDAQQIDAVCRRQTTDATAAILTADGAAPASTNAFLVPANSSFTGCIHIVAESGADSSHWRIDIGTRKRAAAATMAITASTTTLIGQTAGAAAWTVTSVAETTFGSLQISVTGAAATTINWVARYSGVETIKA